MSVAISRAQVFFDDLRERKKGLAKERRKREEERRGLEGIGEKEPPFLQSRDDGWLRP